MGNVKKFFQSKYFYIVLRAIVFVDLGLFLFGLIITEDAQLKSQYIFNIVQCIAFLIVTMLPKLIKKIKVEVPDYFYIIFILFCMAHFILGEVGGFYVNVKGWDSLLHALSGGLITLGCFSFINLLNDNDIVHINKFLVVLSAFTLTVTIGVLWEIVEFAIDGIFDTNMQRAVNSITEEPFIGREALLDTMKDLILDASGSLVVSIICGVIIKRSGEVPKSLISYKVKEEDEENKTIKKEISTQQILNDAEKDLNEVIKKLESLKSVVAENFLIDEQKESEGSQTEESFVKTSPKEEDVNSNLSKTKKKAKKEIQTNLSNLPEMNVEKAPKSKDK